MKHKTCRFTKSLRKNQEKHWKPLMLLRFHVGTQTGRSQTWRRKRKSPELHTKITEYSKQDFNQKCMINSETGGNKTLPLSTAADLIYVAEPSRRPHWHRAGPDGLQRFLQTFLGFWVSTSDSGDFSEREGQDWFQTTTAQPWWCRINGIYRCWNDIKLK